MDDPEPDADDPEPVASWLAAGFDSTDAEVWRRWRFTIARAEAWINAGVTEGLHAAQWMTAGADPMLVQSWRDAGIDASEAVQWHEMGFDVTRARAEKSKGRSPTDAFAQAQPPRPRSGWASVAPTGQRVLRRSGADPRFMHGYMQRQWMDEEAVAWAKQGIEAADAYTWHALGLTPAEAGRLVLQGRLPGEVIREWWMAGIPFEEVADWIGAGLSAQEAVDQRARGITAEQAAALRALRKDESPPGDQSREAWDLTPQGPPGTEIPGPPPADEAAAGAAIERAFAAMTDVDEDGSIRAIDGGSNLGRCLEEAGQRYIDDPETSSRTVKIDAIRFINDHEARVVYSMVINGLRIGGQLLQRRPGRAVLIDGEWKVARDTFCALMQLAGVECPPRVDPRDGAI